MKYKFMSHVIPWQWLVCFCTIESSMRLSSGEAAEPRGKCSSSSRSLHVCLCDALTDTSLCRTLLIAQWKLSHLSPETMMGLVWAEEGGWTTSAHCCFREGRDWDMQARLSIWGLDTWKRPQTSLWSNSYCNVQHEATSSLPSDWNFHIYLLAQHSITQTHNF